MHGPVRAVWSGGTGGTPVPPDAPNRIVNQAHDPESGEPNVFWGSGGVARYWQK
jgi:hypothetical protein